MKIRVLGSAAGGGFPQWNCACTNCSAVRRHQPGYRARTQSQLAISSSLKPNKWHLFNGSPDLRQQLLNHPDMLPDPSAPRSSPIQSMTITNADIDHTLGLLLLRESHRLCVYSSRFVQSALLEGNAYFGMLQQFQGQCDWKTIEANQRFEIQGPDNEPSGLFAEVVELEAKSPFWAKDFFSTHPSSVIGLTISENNDGGKIGYFPGVGKIDKSLMNTLSRCDVILLDGTFWTNDEIQRLRGTGRTALEMGHVPMSGPEGSLEALKSLPSSVKKYFVHINNTNPALDESGDAYKRLRDSGWDLAFDGMEIHL